MGIQLAQLVMLDITVQLQINHQFHVHLELIQLDLKLIAPLVMMDMSVKVEKPLQTLQEKNVQMATFVTQEENSKLRSSWYLAQLDISLVTQEKILD